VVTKNETDKRIFYTALFHSMQHPRLYNDVDGTYPTFASGKPLRKITGGNYYDDMSLWDIYRAQLPLQEILRPAMMNDVVRSLILKGQQGGWMPIFPCWNSYTAAMIGDHAAPVIASAYLKGIRKYNASEGYRLLRQNALTSPANRQDYIDGKGRRALESYKIHGYIPMEDSVHEAFHKKEQVSRTLEYAYDDYAEARLANALGKTDDENLLMKRAGNYRNVYDPTVKMMRGRYANKSFVQQFNPDGKEPFITEGTPRQYSLYVPHDVPGLANLMGGKKELEAALDSLFIKNEYWHGNEPGHQIPFMYNFTNAPWKTQEKVAMIRQEEYSDGPGGLSGNDDAGQMSAWYVFAAMGFYPVNTVDGTYQLCAPLFDQVSIRVTAAKTFKIVTKKANPAAQFISSATLNGKPHTANSLNYSDIMRGGIFEIVLNDTPSATWGSASR
jgi:predicted alpha-1,2-mannosidase